MSIFVPGSPAIRTTTTPPRLGYIVKASQSFRGGETYSFITQDSFGNSVTYHDLPAYELRLAEPGQIPPFDLNYDDHIQPPGGPGMPG